MNKQSIHNRLGRKINRRREGQLVILSLSSRKKCSQAPRLPTQTSALSSCNGLIWELVRNSESWSHPRHSEL